jgi:hypothetical protein
VDRTRCRAITGYLRRTLPRRTFEVGTDDPAAISVSDYDASIKGYHLALAGCIACSKPVPLVRDERQGRFITVKVPEKAADVDDTTKETKTDALVKAVTLTHNTFAFDSLVEAKRWMEGARPFLRAEFLVRLDPRNEASWTFGRAHGVALDLVGARVYNRCTGEVVVSTPPSTGRVERAALGGADDPACKGAVATTGAASPGAGTAGSPAATDATPAELPAQLTKTAIADAMARIRPAVFACYRKFLVAGTIELTYDVAGNGTVQSVQVGPAFAGTPTGMCAQEAGKDARFSPFQLERQKFTYPFFLRP